MKIRITGDPCREYEYYANSIPPSRVQRQPARNAMEQWSADFLRYANSDRKGREITTGDHCFGCTTGVGSSCGALLLVPPWCRMCEASAIREEIRFVLLLRALRVYFAQ